MRIWIDLANSPHVALFEPVIERFREQGWAVALSARNHAQTLELARARWPDIVAIGGESPSGRGAKAISISQRAWLLRSFAAGARADAALSHGSYAQVVAARAIGIPAVTMMDYEYQPANHVSFRLARRVLVPAAFPAEALRRFGASDRKVVRYPGFKEELYLAGYEPHDRALTGLPLDRGRVLAVFRSPPEGALYHRNANARFEEMLEAASSREDVQAVLLPRTRDQAAAAGSHRGVLVVQEAVDGRALLAAADLLIGGGGTMSRESALLGTPTYTVFGGRLAAVDAELIHRGLLHDLRAPGTEPRFEKKTARPRLVPIERREEILRTIESALMSVTA